MSDRQRSPFRPRVSAAIAQKLLATQSALRMVELEPPLLRPLVADKAVAPCENIKDKDKRRDR